jgi:hypothetical protein
VCGRGWPPGQRALARRMASVVTWLGVTSPG